MANLSDGTSVTDFVIDGLCSVCAAVIGAIVLLAIYHALFRLRML
jgi:uncharacterized membrane protein YeaQ/YmgE (transglycosylase-associated protein family)